MDKLIGLGLVAIVSLGAGCAQQPVASTGGIEAEDPALESMRVEPLKGSKGSKVAFFIEGVITEVEDGDTVTIQAVNESEYLIRMSDMDTPETFHKSFKDRRTGETIPDRPGQKHGKAARASLAELVPIGAEARADCYEIETYGRPVCHVTTDRGNLNLIQIERGWGMLARKADWIRDPRSAPAEQAAREAGIGVWADANPTHPEDWRNNCWKGKKICPDPEGP
jgi:endonuclease YncB( thermonuclease family)